jgi:hypothetical protein
MPRGRLQIRSGRSRVGCSTDVRIVEAKWKAYEPEFTWDGSLRDIYVREMDRARWTRFAEIVKALEYPFSFQGRLAGSRFPQNIDELFTDDPEQESTTLVMSVDGVQVNCHFFLRSELELDLDPREVNSSSRLASLFRLMQTIADALDRLVVLTPENAPASWIFRCKPGSVDVEHMPRIGAVT